ncbi:DUF2252 domain-containing protein [Chamaesiphon sp.]|uniref:DUF2252 domain-containing protein n=1 Tax=Chamaesiphon sp. TaxID=2814140 RepID=UPI003592EEC6
MEDISTDCYSRDAWELIQAFNSQRDRQVLIQKYLKMRKDAFTFFRGTCHLFYQDLPRSSNLNLAPVVWICGDLHVENFGTYKGDEYAHQSKLYQRQIYFGINDFDEGVAAPCTWDLARLATSILLSAVSLSLEQAEGQNLVRVYLDAYTSTLNAGKIYPIGDANARGVVADLLDSLQQRKRSELLDKYTELIKNQRRIEIDDRQIFGVSSHQYELVSKAIDEWAQSQTDSAFFEVLDVGFRRAGTGSLGLDRYLVLVTGKGSPDRNYLLDVKQQQSSCLQPYVTIPQPAWANEATRVMEIQRLVQFAPPALLATVTIADRSYLLRELQPMQDKIALKSGSMSMNSLKKLISTMGEVTAVTHLHGSGKLGVAIGQDLIEFSNNLDWQQEVITYANIYVRQVQIDYQNFCEATKYL